jgi:phenylacetate-coenzyme A ligase PaaK-like adenylate-forming protein
MELKSEFTRSVLFPVLLRRWHPHARRYLAELQKFEFATPHDIQTLQWQRLKATVEHAARHVPYYRRLFQKHGIRPNDIESPADFLRVPLLTKGTLQAKLQELIAEDRDKNEGLSNASGGSTGKPVQFFQDAEYWNRAYASLWFVESWWGIRPGDRTASLWGADRDIPEQSWKERLIAAIWQTRVCNAFALTGSRLEAFAMKLVRWQPRHIIGYASALEIFAKFLLEHPEFQIRPQAVKTTADVLGDESRKLIQAAFACPVYNFYGSREINNLAAECPARRGLHVNALTRYIEIVDDAGNPQPPHVPGRILLTDLTNRFMPLMRYEIEDIGSWASESCTCGRPFPLLERVWGRSSDFIVTPEGKLIHSVFFTHLFYDMPQVALFQINQTELREIDVFLALCPDVTEYPAELLHARLAKALGPAVRFTVQVVSEIKRPPSGKHRFTVSSVRPSWTQEQPSLFEKNRVAVV